jgi:pilus assembly protein Flp/PilA
MLMLKLWMMVQKVLQKEEGQSMVEYGLIIALIAVVVIAALVVLGPKIAGLFSNVATNIP